MRIKACILVAAILLSIPVSGKALGAVPTLKHTEYTAYNWYFKRNSEHLPPALPSEFSFIKDNGGFYLDTNVKEEDKVIYLTFDAGYENGNIGKILDIMKKHNAKGAFFVLGNLIKRDTEIVKRMVDEGHLVCNHTNSHHDMTKCRSLEKFKCELDSLNEIMKEYCGCELAPFYRPPEGRFSESNLKYANECGYRTVFWSFAYADWDNNKQIGADKALGKVLSGTHNGEVLLLHPTSKTNAEILDSLLTEWENNCYSFGTLYELTRRT